MESCLQKLNSASVKNELDKIDHKKMKDFMEK
jgi:hypothetical protein